MGLGNKIKGKDKVICFNGERRKGVGSKVISRSGFELPAMSLTVSNVAGPTSPAEFTRKLLLYSPAEKTLE